VQNLISAIIHVTRFTRQRPPSRDSLVGEEASGTPVALKEDRVSGEHDDDDKEDKSVPRQVRLKRGNVRKVSSIDSLSFTPVVEPKV
jgi:hypothetical protein